MMKKLKMKRLTVVSMLVATMSILWVDSISINGVSKSNIVRNADSVDTEYNLGDSSEINVTAVSNLMGKIMGETSPKSYDELKTYMISTEGNVRTGEQIGTQVILGGYTWNVVYSSLTGTSETSNEERDVVATLWLSESDIKVKWNMWSGPDMDTDYPSSMYSSSYIRSYLTGEKYIAKADDAELTVGEQNEAWKGFLDKYTKYITTPSEIAYQETESLVKTNGFPRLSPNEAYGTPEEGNWYDDKMDFKDKLLYSEWKNDKIWLPSLTETGCNQSGENSGTTNKTGIWNMSPEARKNVSSTWLRSGHTSSTYMAYFLQSNGSYSMNNVEDSYAIRPAFHLNLKTASTPTKKITQPTFNKDSLIYSTKSQTITLSSTEGITLTLPEGWTINENTITIPEKLEPGTYTIKIKPKEFYAWSDGTCDEINISLLINDAPSHDSTGVIVDIIIGVLVLAPIVAILVFVLKKRKAKSNVTRNKK